MSRDCWAFHATGICAGDEAIREGGSISMRWRATASPRRLALRMLRVGERTGRMGEMMERIAAFHDEEMARWVECSPSCSSRC